MLDGHAARRAIPRESVLMQVTCPHCQRILDYSVDPPLFCAYCGQPLQGRFDPARAVTMAFQPLVAKPKPGTNLGWPGSQDLTLDDPRAARDRARAGDDEPMPERVAGYRIIRRLGRGGMGSVYEAIDEEHGQHVALKLIAADHVSSREAVERFRQEGRLASTLTSSRCVFVLTADEDQGRPYIVMDLMPGETLQTLIEARGALPVPEAIAKILDVIEGLHEAHLVGIVHRDVKPSNCFLEANGRVKIGDFGLSKSLDNDAGLTVTGSFLGTPLYASPEQIKRDEVDARTDVYSVAATLYFLLTAKPPFLAEDAASTLAKIVSEPPTPMRRHRPELPPALESVIFRGLERDRERRWQTLMQFRRALLPFISDTLGFGDLALRVTAFLTDAALLAAVHWLFITLALAISPMTRKQAAAALVEHALQLTILKRLVFMAYFGVMEGELGTTVGKALTGLRVSGTEARGPAGWQRGLLRAAAFYGLTFLLGDVLSVLVFELIPTTRVLWFETETLSVFITCIGFLVVTTSMRARNGYRGLHELISGTQVLRLPRSSRLRAPRARDLPNRPDRARALTGVPSGVLQSIGPFRVRGAVLWEGDRRVLLAEDSTLERPVWIAIRPKGSPLPPAGRRDLTRPSRPRWLRGGEQPEGRWDAYVAPSGCPLADLAGPLGLPWANARLILHDLAEELALASADGTLPANLSVDQVWILANGCVQLVDTLGLTASETTPAAADPDATAARCLDLLRRTAALALEGGRFPHNGPSPDTIRSPVPEHAARMLDRLIGHPRDGDAPYTDLASFVADLEADRDQPTEVDTPRRAAHLAPEVVAMAFPMVAMFMVTCPLFPPWEFADEIVTLLPLLWIMWPIPTRGGVLLNLAGLALVRSDSRPAEWWRRGWRSLVTWGPVSFLFNLVYWAINHHPPLHRFALLTWGFTFVFVASYPILALIYPNRGPHDRLAGTWVVPK